MAAEVGSKFKKKNDGKAVLQKKGPPLNQREANMVGFTLIQWRAKKIKIVAVFFFFKQKTAYEIA